MKNFQEWYETKILIEALKNKDYFDEILRVARKLYYEKNIDASNSSLEEIIQALNDLKVTPPSGVTMARFAAGIKMIDRGKQFLLQEARKAGVYPTKAGKVTIWIGDSNSWDAHVTAKIGNKIVGKLILHRNKNLQGKNEIYKVAVDEPYKRSGIGTLMYKAAESEFGEISPSAVLSDEAFDFWKKYRPEVFSKNDLRLYKDKIIGRFIEDPKFGRVQIQSVAKSIAIAKILSGEKAGLTTAVNYDMIVDQLGLFS